MTNETIDNLIWHRNILAQLQGKSEYTARELYLAWKGKFDFTMEEIKAALGRAK